jgi:hypothetical protein
LEKTTVLTSLNAWNAYAAFHRLWCSLARVILTRVPVVLPKQIDCHEAAAVKTMPMLRHQLRCELLDARFELLRKASTDGEENVHKKPPVMMLNLCRALAVCV